jgi:hypothetical protein
MPRIGQTYPRYLELAEPEGAKFAAAARRRARYESILAIATRFFAALGLNRT